MHRGIEVRHLVVICFALALVAAPGMARAEEAEEAGVEACLDAVDNDGDGDIDCEDRGCREHCGTSGRGGTGRWVRSERSATWMVAFGLGLLVGGITAGVVGAAVFFPDDDSSSDIAAWAFIGAGIAMVIPGIVLTILGFRRYRQPRESEARNFDFLGLARSLETNGGETCTVW